MAEQIKLLTALNLIAVKGLRKDGIVVKHDSFDTIPLPFKEEIRNYLIDYVGFETGPIYHLARINGNPVSLRGNAFGGDMAVTDILPIGAGDVIFELQVPADCVVFLGMNKLFELIEYSRQFGEDNELVLSMLKDSLSVGVITTDEENVFAFTAKIRREECVKFVRLDEQWKSDYSDAISNIEEVTVSTLAKF